MNSVTDHVLAARTLRARLQADPHRPRYHLIPPEGWFNDANGALYHNGRYHLFYLARTPIPDAENPGERRWVEVWDHVSSSDLVHWTWHRPALEPAPDGSTPLGIWSGGAIDGSPTPALIYHVPGQGTCIATSDDPDLDRWTPLVENPVISATDTEEYRVFDPCAWREGDAYYALVGNKNRRPGYEGDSTSLFRSADLRSWEYVGPFFRSRREWTDEVEDAACPDFYPLGDTHMLLMHGHNPYFQCHYYLGRYENHRFHPEEHGRMNWPGGQISGPETLQDDRGRRIFFGWVMEADSRSGERDWRKTGWASVMSLPRLFEHGPGGLRITPVPELERLRRRHLALASRSLPAISDRPDLLPDVRGTLLEIDVEIEPGAAARVGLAVRCSPDGAEQTPIVYDARRGVLTIDLAKSTLDEDICYPRFSGSSMEGVPEDERSVSRQEAPFRLAPGEALRLHVYVDRSIVEVFANDRICLTQRVYPARADSDCVALFADSPDARATRVDVWELEPAMPW